MDRARGLSVVQGNDSKCADIYGKVVQHLRATYLISAIFKGKNMHHPQLDSQAGSGRQQYCTLLNRG